MLNFFKRKKPTPTSKPTTPTPDPTTQVPVLVETVPSDETSLPTEAAWRSDVAAPPAATVPPTSLVGATLPASFAVIPPAAPTTPLPSSPPASPATTSPVSSSSTAEASSPASAKPSWLQRLKRGLSRTGQSISGLFVGSKIDENLFEELETALIMADTGMEATQKLLNALRERVKSERLEAATQVRDALQQLLAQHLRPLEAKLDFTRVKPLVIMMMGVNGAGKTTSIGKLTHYFQQQGCSVLLAAGDTFRAAAREQLMAWGARNHVTVIAQEGGDPAAVAFDAVNAGRARGAAVVMVDTAGRLPTQSHLMQELKKIHRVIGKADSTAPHEALLVVDGNTGQNVLAQIRAFDAIIPLTGLIVTKLDGTAKGGALAAVAAGSQGVRPVPVYWIGLGEGLEDLQPFVANDFAQALIDPVG